MSQERLPPPPAEECLDRSYPSTQKGGTLIATEVVTFEEHERRLADPDGYRPPKCPRCGHPVMHVHDYRVRVLLAEPDLRVTRVVRHRCAHEECRAAWQTLPLIVARWLHRTWAAVQSATVGPSRVARPSVPARTRRRWWSRLHSSARVARNVLASSGDEDGAARVARATAMDATRQELVQSWGKGLALLAGLLHCLERGVRLM